MVPNLLGPKCRYRDRSRWLGTSDLDGMCPDPRCVVPWAKGRHIILGVWVSGYNLLPIEIHFQSQTTYFLSLQPHSHHTQNLPFPCHLRQTPHTHTLSIHTLNLLLLTKLHHWHNLQHPKPYSKLTPWSVLAKSKSDWFRLCFKNMLQEGATSCYTCQ